MKLKIYMWCAVCRKAERRAFMRYIKIWWNGNWIHALACDNCAAGL